MSPREKRKLHMEQKGYTKLPSQERENKLQKAFRFWQEQMAKLTPEAQDLLRRGECEK
jgi:hypothetical protein